MEITEALAIELTKNHLVNGQDEKPKSFRRWNDGNATVTASDGRIFVFNRVEVKHAEIMLANRKEER